MVNTEINLSYISWVFLDWRHVSAIMLDQGWSRFTIAAQALNRMACFDCFNQDPSWSAMKCYPSLSQRPVFSVIWLLFFSSVGEDEPIEKFQWAWQYEFQSTFLWYLQVQISPDASTFWTWSECTKTATVRRFYLCTKKKLNKCPGKFLTNLWVRVVSLIRLWHAWCKVSVVYSIWILTKMKKMEKNTGDYLKINMTPVTIGQSQPVIIY